jgi:iron complex outermembrane receptor protein
MVSAHAMKPNRQPHVRAGSVSVLCLALAAAVEAQDPKPGPQDEPGKPSEAPPVREVGGRLVVSGETVVVTADLDQPPRDSSVATKIDTPLLETPRSVSVVDRRTLDDLGAISITQAHDYAVGLTPIDERGPASARGFPVDFYDLRRDGLRTYSWSVREPVAVDRIQYLRGPAAVLYGDGSPGGLVNMVLKKPLPVPRYEIGLSGGSLGFGRLTADLTGPLSGGRSVRYRVVAALETLENGFDNDERRMTLLPTLAVDLAARGTLTLDTEWYDQRGRNYRHAVPATADAQRGDFSGFPWDLSVNSPDYGWTGGNVSPGLRLDLELGRRSSLHVAGRYTKIDGDIDGQGLAALAPDGRTVIRYQYHEISTWHEYQSDTFAATTVSTGRLEHRIVAGLEAGLSTADTEIGIGPATPLDIFDPVYPPQPEPAARPTRYDVSRLGLYAVDQVRIGARVIVVPAVRWSRLGVENRVATTAEPTSTESVVSPSLGLLALPKRWLSLYASYTQGFEPPTPGQYLEDGRALAAAEHEALEGGVKADLFDRRISLTGAAFRIRRTNVPEADARGFFRQIGEAGSHGLELELVGSVTPGWGVRGGYAWTSTEITRDTSGFAGRALPNAPRHKAELWTRYRVQQGRLKGLMVAGGVVHVSERFTARDNAVVMPAYTRVDGSAAYELAGSRLTIGLAAQNLTNRRYVTSGAGAVFIAGPPRRLAVSLTFATVAGGKTLRP